MQLACAQHQQWQERQAITFLTLIMLKSKFIKKNFSVFFLLLICGTLYSQNIQNIKFIYVGIELRSPGVLSISTWKPVKPTDINADSIHHLSLFTDLNTFEFIKKFIKSRHYIVRGTTKNHYLIKSTFQSNRYLPLQYVYNFFNSLSDSLKKGNFDKNVINALDKYIGLTTN
jgi:hypothetical protein